MGEQERLTYSWEATLKAELAEGGPKTALVQSSRLSSSEFLRHLAACFAKGLKQLLRLPKRCFGRLSDMQADMEFLLELEGGPISFEDLFDIREQIGQGTFGKVYACKSFSSATRAADDSLCVKVVATKGRHAAREAKLSSDEKLELLRLIEALDHPNIVRYQKFVQTSDTLYIVMNRCLGPDLVDHMEASGEALPLASVRDMARQIVMALAAVHDKGIMHRDVKPENFRFKDPGATTLQLLDFGAAKPSDDTPKVHTVTGTLLYAAPEVFDGFYSRSCDLWSCGVVLFLLVAGNLPFQTSDVTMLRSMHRDPVLMGDCLFRGERWRKAPEAARSLVRGLLTVDVASRLTALAACDHQWVASGSGDEDKDQSAENAGKEGASEDGVSALRRCGSSRIALADLKRTYFVWNLAECNGAESPLTFSRQATPEEAGLPSSAAGA
eukprot:gb/GFBE01051831.1/.p1 GENE.gb/GFBE01051831.1/~~gb/GFBE01051831.1/.p1  ORF type:complete len:441 (+),score=97.95 gb/GFBE01051831.1/:1-1323(+)